MRHLIINADDLGYDPAVDRGLLRAMREGVVSSATLMVNTAFSREAARAA
ncbi:MAG TPA: ChbG/HpnK family deacetylase, partial [Myxococcaceae bacterium]|nr:ChbG/HpnK family deacetylase [Myxococcaceae bacterium]